MQGILTADLVNRAFGLVRSFIELSMKSGIGENLAIVVTATYGINPWSIESDKTFEDTCYLITAIGEPARSKYPIVEIALSKAELSARTGLPTSKLPPQYLLDNDTLFYGSAVIDGIVVACSGLKPYHDEMFSYWIASAVQAEAKKALERMLSGEKNFVG